MVYGPKFRIKQAGPEEIINQRDSNRRNVISAIHLRILAVIKAAVAAICLILALAPLTGANDKNQNLIVAAEKGDQDNVQRLLNEGADVNAKESDGWTALKIARQRGQKEIEELLIAHGAKE